MPILASALNPQMSPALDAVLVQAMAKDKAKRFATAEALHAVCALKDLDDLPRKMKGAQ